MLISSRHSYRPQFAAIATREPIIGDREAMEREVDDVRGWPVASGFE
jgi:hypothetical protein